MYPWQTMIQDDMEADKDETKSFWEERVSKLDTVMNGALQLLREESQKLREERDRAQEEAKALREESQKVRDERDRAQEEAKTLRETVETRTEELRVAAKEIANARGQLNEVQAELKQVDQTNKDNLQLLDTMRSTVASVRKEQTEAEEQMESKMRLLVDDLEQKQKAIETLQTFDRQARIERDLRYEAACHAIAAARLGYMGGVKQRFIEGEMCKFMKRRQATVLTLRKANDERLRQLSYEFEEALRIDVPSLHRLFASVAW